MLKKINAVITLAAHDFLTYKNTNTIKDCIIPTNIAVPFLF